MRDTTEHIRGFYNGFVSRLAAKNVRHDHVCRSLLRCMPTSGSLLDIGCGAGITSKHLADIGHTVTAVDLSDRAIEYALEHNSHENIKYICSDIAELDVDDVYDYFVMVDVLEHLPEESVDATFQLIDSCSHYDSTVYLNVPDANLSSWLNDNRPHLTQPIDNAVSHEKIVGMFGDIGFKPVYYNFYWQEYVEYYFATEQMVEKLFTKKYKGD